MSENSNNHHAPVRPKDYTGSKVVPHTVQAGETLASIAATYPFLKKNWKPVWIYNSQVRKTLDDNPDLVRRGVTILIPRSPQGYADLIKKLEGVRRDAEYLGEKIGYELEAETNYFEAYKIKLNLASDALLTFASLGLKALAAANASKAVTAAKGQAKIAQQLSSNATTKEFATKFAEFRSKNIREALKQHRDMRTARDAFKHKVGQDAVGIAADLADAQVKERIGEDAAWFKDTHKAMTTIESVREAWKEIGVGRKAGSFLQTALEFMGPHGVACAWLLVTSGETVSQSQEKAALNLAAATKRSLEQIDAQIAATKAECKLLYG